MGSFYFHTRCVVCDWEVFAIVATDSSDHCEFYMQWMACKHNWIYSVKIFFYCWNCWQFNVYLCIYACVDACTLFSTV